jgi:hypothetical protein
MVQVAVVALPSIMVKAQVGYAFCSFVLLPYKYCTSICSMVKV